MKAAVFALMAIPAIAASIPAGTEIGIRLTDKIASDKATANAAVHAVVIAPVVIDGRIVLPAGPELTGTLKEARAASATERAQVHPVFSRIVLGAYSANLSAVIGGLENS